SAAQPEIDDGGDDTILPQLIETLVRGLRGHDREAVHLEKLHQRAPNGDVVFDDEYETRGFSGHRFSGSVRGRGRVRLSRSTIDVCRAGPLAQWQSTWLLITVSRVRSPWGRPRAN